MVSHTLPALAGDSGLSTYLQAIRAFPMLKPNEEYMLAKRYREHADREAAHDLVTSHLRLVVKMARRYVGYGLPLSDLISEGNIGLMSAVRKFDPEKGFRLATYARWWIKSAIAHFVLKSWSLVRIGSLNSQKKLFYTLRTAKHKLAIMDHGDLTPEDADRLADRYSLPADEITRVNQRITRRDYSLNQRIGDGDGTDEYIDCIPAVAPNPESSFADLEERDYQKRLIAEAMAGLKLREREIISARWLTEKPATLEELGKRLRLSRERVRQLEKHALEFIKAKVGEWNAFDGASSARTAGPA